jgi:hypothetical protein
MDHDVVRAHGMSQPRRQRRDGFLETLVLEGSDPPASIADHVVVMIPTGKRRLISRHASPDLDSLD